MILIVDDEPTALLLLETVLRRENSAGTMIASVIGVGGIRKAKSGKEALAVL